MSLEQQSQRQGERLGGVPGVCASVPMRTQDSSRTQRTAHAHTGQSLRTQDDLCTQRTACTHTGWPLNTQDGLCSHNTVCAHTGQPVYSEDSVCTHRTAHVLREQPVLTQDSLKGWKSCCPRVMVHWKLFFLYFSGIEFS